MQSDRILFPVLTRVESHKWQTNSSAGQPISIPSSTSISERLYAGRLVRGSVVATCRLGFFNNSRDYAGAGRGVMLRARQKAWRTQGWCTEENTQGAWLIRGPPWQRREERHGLTQC